MSEVAFLAYCAGLGVIAGVLLALAIHPLLAATVRRDLRHAGRS